MSENNQIINKNKAIYLRVSKIEYELIKKRANYTNLSISKYLRTIGINGAIIKYEPIDFKNIINEMNKIGTNINQIAKKVNESNLVSQTDFNNLEKAYEDLFELYINRAMGEQEE